jgi:hypothetical protein
MLGNNFLKKRQSKIFPVIMLLVMLFFLCGISSCNNTGLPPTVDYHKGTSGIDIRFLAQAPPDELYEGSAFSVNIMAENKGAYDVAEDKYGLLSLSYDPLYIDASGFQSSDNVIKGENSILFKNIQLYGKSRYHPTGSFSFLSFSNFKTATVIGQRERPATQILASFCYPYVTVFSGIVCIDLSGAGTNLRKQVCTQQNLLPAQGQGAPVAVTQVEVENQPAGNEVVRPVFTIHIQNKGSGNVLSPASNPIDFERVCSFKDLKRQDFNTVEISAILSTGTQLECKPNPMKLYGGEGFTRCQVQEDDLVIGHQNYESVLNVNLSYVYLTAMPKEIAIKRLNVYGDSITPASGCLLFEVASGSGCEIKCNYCVTHPSDGLCQPGGNHVPVNFQPGFGCLCGSDKCKKELYPKGLCADDQTFCPGGSYCCLPECTSSQIRINGKCYSKCSKCSKITADCACGSGTEESGYAVVVKDITKDSYCCTKDSQPYSDKVSCDAACKQATSAGI